MIDVYATTGNTNAELVAAARAQIAEIAASQKTSGS
jgi:hypothetical protein